MVKKAGSWHLTTCQVFHTERGQVDGGGEATHSKDAGKNTLEPTLAKGTLPTTSYVLVCTIWIQMLDAYGMSTFLMSATTADDRTGCINEVSHSP